MVKRLEDLCIQKIINNPELYKVAMDTKDGLPGTIQQIIRDKQAAAVDLRSASNNIPVWGSWEEEEQSHCR